MNFCGLNKNTRKNILRREREERMSMSIGEIMDENENDDDENNKIELSKGYLVDFKNIPIPDRERESIL